MKSFFRDDRGYALVLTLVFLPAFLGLTLLMIDVGRGNNAHSDHQAAADALALAAARELDGGADAITRAELAMANVTNSVAYLARSGNDTLVTLNYPGGEPGDDEVTFTVIYLTEIPASDDEPINQDWVDDHTASGGEDARYVYVRTQARDLDGFFFNPATFLRPSTPVAAQAVATYRAAACDVTPLFICNPFETATSQPGDLQEAFARGDLHGRLIQLRPKGSNTALPGNFGFLAAPDADSSSQSGRKVLAEMLAGRPNPTCYEAGTVETQTGAVTSVRNGLNTRMDMYEGDFRKAVTTFPPALSVRKGYTYTGQACRATEQSDTTIAFGFPRNGEGVNIDGRMEEGDGARIGWGDWDIRKYLLVNFRLTLDEAEDSGLKATHRLSGPRSEDNNPGATVPSRYDVYRWEVTQSRDFTPPLLDRRSGSAPNGSGQGEVGNPVCYASKGNSLPAPSDDPDRRILFAAIIDCVKYRNDLTNKQGGKVSIPVNSFASLFLTNPMDKNLVKEADCLQDARNKYGNNRNQWTDEQLAEYEECVSAVSDDQTIDVEIIDITGSGSNGTLEAFLREEAFLVR